METEGTGVLRPPPGLGVRPCRVQLRQGGEDAAGRFGAVKSSVLEL